jgi:hypothetical protein
MKTLKDVQNLYYSVLEITNRIENNQEANIQFLKKLNKLYKKNLIALCHIDENAQSFFHLVIYFIVEEEKKLKEKLKGEKLPF